MHKAIIAFIKDLNPVRKAGIIKISNVAKIVDSRPDNTKKGDNKINITVEYK